mmetsp:Transcript_16010/g.38780  ORF Transcript_16010/g.38780 Transcript_16010/m.38780 type:complete len:362 (-) Transcript_16010:32-1117(-)
MATDVSTVVQHQADVVCSLIAALRTELPSLAVDKVLNEALDARDAATIFAATKSRADEELERKVRQEVGRQCVMWMDDFKEKCTCRATDVKVQDAQQRVEAVTLHAADLHRQLEELQAWKTTVDHKLRALDLASFGTAHVGDQPLIQVTNRVTALECEHGATQADAARLKSQLDSLRDVVMDLQQEAKGIEGKASTLAADKDTRLAGLQEGLDDIVEDITALRSFAEQLAEAHRSQIAFRGCSVEKLVEVANLVGLRVDDSSGRPWTPGNDAFFRMCRERDLCLSDQIDALQAEKASVSELRALELAVHDLGSRVQWRSAGCGGQWQPTRVPVDIHSVGPPRSSSPVPVQSGRLPRQIFGL